MGCERMPQGMATGMLNNARLTDGFFNGSLQERFMKVMPPLLARLEILPASLLCVGKPTASAILPTSPSRAPSRKKSALFFVEQVQLLEAMRLRFEGAGLKARTIQHQHPGGLLAGPHAPDTELVGGFVSFAVAHRFSCLPSSLASPLPFDKHTSCSAARVNACLSRKPNVRFIRMVAKPVSP